MHEIFPPKKEVAATQEEVSSLEYKIAKLKLVLVDKLIKIGTRLKREGIEDGEVELDEDLLLKFDKIKEVLHLEGNDSLVEDIFVLGCYIDLRIKNNEGIATTILNNKDELAEIVIALLQIDIPEATEEHALTVLVKVIDTHKGGYFIDTLLDAIAIRKEEIRKVQSSYVIDDKTGVVQPKEI
jgi:hypothetical protein